MNPLLETILRVEIADCVNLLLCSQNKESRDWSDSIGDESIFANYVAIWACFNAGLKNDDRLLQAANKLMEARLKNGTWAYNNGKNPIEATSRAIIALLLTSQIDSQEAKTAIDSIVACQHEDEGWQFEDSDVKSEAGGIGRKR